ncbi:ribulose-phosphate 3-epimerase [Paenibacillus sp. IHB B 3415]|uniref:ribulose-phosphate 3-epimerase n=1 Tax=Paenibacillus sp. IHB B 3415 TaxID=867080 RepID=UPI0005738471|nr:ribulose-phosphate 3-epimerase [Paenibacillus sp. IHB B 3415]KHL97164.1 ribulose-phosphate 3-epimerase [Paenibacillus sp. IHB B 3415]
MSILLCPSMMCANFESLGNEVASLDEANIDVYHIDIMDGRFVPNFGMGLQDLEFIRSHTSKLVDVHLMIDNPSSYIDLFCEKGADIIYFHPEADTHPTRTIDRIHAHNVNAGIALNPGTSIAHVEPLLGLVEYVLVMTVNPGFAGQKYLAYVNDKIKTLNEFKQRHQLEFMIVVDGAISEDKIAELIPFGVEGYVLGTSTLFGKEESYSSIIKRLKY